MERNYLQAAERNLYYLRQQLYYKNQSKYTHIYIIDTTTYNYFFQNILCLLHGYNLKINRMQALLPIKYKRSVWKKVQPLLL